MPTTEEVVDRLQAFWEKRRIRVACPICRVANWNLSHKAEIYVPTVIASEAGATAASAGAHAAYALHCTNCGFVINFMKEIVDETDLTTIRQPET